MFTYLLYLHVNLNLFFSKRLLNTLIVILQSNMNNMQALKRLYAWIGFITFWSLLLLGTYEVIKWVYLANKFINESLASF